MSPMLRPCLAPLIRSPQRKKVPGPAWWFLFFAFVFAPSVASAAPKWPPLDPAEFRRSEPLVDRSAGVEILLREVVVENSHLGFEVKHFIRARLFSDVGLERLSRINIPYERSFSISGIEARTIKPNGTVVRLGRKDIYDRGILEAGEVSTRLKSFAPPGVERGAIVEYQYTEFTDTMMQYLPLFFQSDLPARLVRFKVKPFGPPLQGLRALYFNCPARDLVQDSDGYYVFELPNIPARKSEPYRPPALQAEPVIVLRYTEAGNTPPSLYWRVRGADLHRESEIAARVTPAIESIAAGLVSPNDTPSEKLSKLYDYCRIRIANRDRESSRFTPQQRRKFAPNATAQQTLKLGHGAPADINTLFLALARAAGLEAYHALVNDRNLIVYEEQMIEPFIFTHAVVAVRQDGWKFYDPGAIYPPPGLLNWQYSDTSALIAHPTAAQVVAVPGAAGEVSQRTRHGRFKLEMDGTLQGEVQVDFTGLWDAEAKRIFDPISPQARIKRVAEEVTALLRQGEVSNVVVEHANELSKPLRISYHLRVPGYAEQTGTRLILQPSVFQKGARPRFEAAQRSTDLALHYRFTEVDDIIIQVPSDLAVETISTPGLVDMQSFGQYITEISAAENSGSVSCNRRLQVNGVHVERSRYNDLKSAFDEIHLRDNLVVTLRRNATGHAPRRAP